jgi:hypothetical protein
MYELIPIFAGLVAGAAATRLTGRAGLALIAGTALVVGPLAAAISGELAESWAFLLWDTAQAFVAGVATYVAIMRLASRQSG